MSRAPGVLELTVGRHNLKRGRVSGCHNPIGRSVETREWGHHRVAAGVNLCAACAHNHLVQVVITARHDIRYNIISSYDRWCSFSLQSMPVSLTTTFKCIIAVSGNYKSHAERACFAKSFSCLSHRRACQLITLSLLGASSDPVALRELKGAQRKTKCTSTCVHVDLLSLS